MADHPCREALPRPSVKLDRVELRLGADDPVRRRFRHRPMSFLPRACLPVRRQENMMLTVETLRLEEWFAVDPSREAGLRAVAPRAGTVGRWPVGAAGDRTIGAVVRMGERGAL
jgi:hypothetical protein